MNDRVPVVVTLLALGLLVVPGVLQSTTSMSDDDGPRPFDPLSSYEERRAIEVAESNETIAGLLGARSETIGAALRTEKIDGPLTGMPRRADVWFYNYVTDQTVWAVVDLDEDRVLDLVDAPDYQPPLTEGEIQTAGELALQHANVTARLSGVDVQEWLGYRSPGARQDTCQVNRCLLVTPVIDGSVADFLVRVNLSESLVEQVIERPPHNAEVVP